MRMMSAGKALWAITAAVLCSSRAGWAQITVPKILSDHMVVQRDLPVHVWGTAKPGEQVNVSFRGETRTATAEHLGLWSVYLKPGAAGGPFEINISGDGPSDRVAIHDVLVGDVWVASGQSNMEFAMRQAATAASDLPKVDNAHIRLMIVNKKASDFPQDDVDSTGWSASTPETAKNFSAVAWYFAREIEQREHVPVGVIDSTWGGTVAEAWTRLTALGEDAALSPLFASRGKQVDAQVDNARAIAEEQRQAAEDKAAGKPVVPPQWHPTLESWGAGKSVQRNDCATNAVSNSRSDLVPGRKQQRAGALASIQPHYAHAD